MKRIREHKNKGFSFVEVLLAVAILGLIATPIFQMFMTSYQISGKSKESLAAADLSQTIMEYISSSSFEDYVSTSDPTLTKVGLKTYYFTSPHATFKVVPNGPSCGHIDNALAARQVTYKGVNYEGYSFNVKLSYVEPDDTSGEYFTYQVICEIRNSDGVFFNEARTEVVNKF